MLYHNNNEAQMTCNILIMGITGVGKSALVNYLAGETVAESGITNTFGGLTRGIIKYPITINNQESLVADTEGLEATHAEEWYKIIDEALLNSNYEKDISEWYHIVIYCIGANGGRVQDLELEMLKKLVKAGYGVIVAFTKADLATDDDLLNLKNAIDEYFEHKVDFKYIPVCSKKGRIGNLEGKEELSEAIIDGWGQSLLNRLPDAVYNPAFSELSSFASETIYWIIEQKIGLLDKSKDDVLKELNTSIKRKMTQIFKEIEKKKTLLFTEVQSVYNMLNLVIDAKTITQTSTKLKSKIKALDSNIMTNNAFKNALFTGGTALLAIAAMPVVALSVAVIGLIWNSIDKDKQKAELIQGFQQQYERLYQNLFEQMKVFTYQLGIMMGKTEYYEDLALCFLEEKGVSKNNEQAINYLNHAIEQIDDENSYKKSELQFYLALAYYNQKNKEESDYWLTLACNNENEKALRIQQGESFEAIINESKNENDKMWQEIFEDSKVDNLVYSFEMMVINALGLDMDATDIIDNVIADVGKYLAIINYFKPALTEGNLKDLLETKDYLLEFIQDNGEDDITKEVDCDTVNSAFKRILGI